MNKMYDKAVVNALKAVVIIIMVVHELTILIVSSDVACPPHFMGGGMQVKMIHRPDRYLSEIGILTTRTSD